MEQVIVVTSIWIAAPKERVWRAVTDAKQLSLWYAPNSPWDIPELQAGASVYFHHSPNAYHTGTEVVTLRATIAAVEPMSRFSLRWELESPGTDMITTFLLAEENGGTRATITETGYETREQAKPTEEGYAMSLENLKAHAEGRNLPH